MASARVYVDHAMLNGLQIDDQLGMQNCNLHNLPENYTMRYCAFGVCSGRGEAGRGVGVERIEGRRVGDWLITHRCPICLCLSQTFTTP